LTHSIDWLTAYITSTPLVIRHKDATRFWFDTRANLRREMEDRKGRFNDHNDVRDKRAEVLRKLMPGEINANFPNGASDQIRRATSENAKSLGFKTSTWE